MGSLCFSTASILRCESFTALESQLLIIPTAVELLFATSLIYANWGKGRRHLLLTAEGWSYFALALLDIVDTVLGAASFVPIFFYTLFIYLFTRGELIDTLPKRFQRIASVLLAVFIPAIIALNELSSFIGIHRRTLRNAAGRPVVAIGFASVSDQQLWTFLTSLTLALLTAFQAIAFALTFYRLIRALIDQRRIETTATESSHAVRGTSWLSAGLKLGAIETVVGFAQGGFGGALTRRVVRAVARGCMAVGVAKGVDAVDDFADLAQEMSGGRSTTFRRSRLGMLISNPRASTFRQLSPTAGEFYRANGPTPRGDVEKAGANGGLAVPQMSEFAQLRLAAGARPPASPLYTLAGPQNQLTSPPLLQRTLTQGTAYTSRTLDSTTQQRVTVHFPQGSDGAEGAPTLHMRFSGLEMPSPALIAEEVGKRPVSEEWVSIARSSRYAPSIAPSFAFDPIPPMAAAPPLPTANGVTYPQFIYERNAVPVESTIGDASSAYSYPAPRDSRGKGKAPAHARELSTASGLAAVRELAGQFPVPRPSPIPEAPSGRQREWDAERGVAPYAYGGAEHEEEEVYRYAYDGPVSSPEHELPPPQAHIPHPYADAAAYGAGMHSPAARERRVLAAVGRERFGNSQSQNQTRHRNGRSDTTLGMTPQTFASSRFESNETSTPNTEAEESVSGSDPFQFDVALDTGMSGKAAAYRAQQRQQSSDGELEYADEERYSFPQEGQGVPEEVFLGDGPHSDYKGHMHNASVGTRTSAALLQMTQRPAADWAPGRVLPERLQRVHPRHPRVSERSDLPASVDTLASSWLHGDGMLHDELADADEGSVGRVRAPRKATPAPVSTKHGLTRGSVYIQPITVPPVAYSSEVQIVQGGSSADSYNSEFVVGDRF
ncbi:hypothetical protein B0H14DRAFT_3908209 [Mycena olivaceomarginata]|nr:hypothetical protein B0H14DRAFT_3908209 [Mycena olivaceomarginata]